MTPPRCPECGTRRTRVYGDGTGCYQAGDLGCLTFQLATERALSDALAGALRAVRADRPSAHSDRVWQQLNAAIDKYDKHRANGAGEQGR